MVRLGWNGLCPPTCLFILLARVVRVARLRDFDMGPAELLQRRGLGQSAFTITLPRPRVSMFAQRRAPEFAAASAVAALASPS